jgi:hypothetical protein
MESGHADHRRPWDRPASLPAMEPVEHASGLCAQIRVPTGTQTSIEALRRRYWSVFGLTPFEAVVSLMMV